MSSHTVVNPDGQNVEPTIVSPPINIIVFGESGAVKTSVINMLTEEPVAAVSNQAVGCTYASTKHRATIDGREVMLYDTAGLNEAGARTVSPQQAIQNLRSLADDLKTVNLLVHCIRGTWFREIVADNYNIFRKMICGRARGPKVPIVLVITGLENEDNMDDWWEDNKAYFDQYKLEFCGHVCITATRGRALKDGSGYTFQDLYDTSKEKVMKLLVDNAFGSIIPIVPPKDNPTPVRGVSSSPNPCLITVLLRWCEEQWNQLRE
ncbi:hypothetical protein K503DRAFT_766885 [Rhizopogon vinicolor AM-OR11-026]|uniref:G domain-containing protein n=1 Tax=Rhizopogon vinicolor AM-OR11-026 TaxID=1314800 RepID=A0A1B7NBS6_9AGAM|nr:hypothetical protein K503DRAFT_766885 [Rhizopogon vinicolor AM-OR11-026]